MPTSSQKNISAMLVDPILSWPIAPVRHIPPNATANPLPTARFLYNDHTINIIPPPNSGRAVEINSIR